MHALTTVTTASADTELTEPIQESILAAVEHYLIGADEHAELKPYATGEHTAPVKLQHPLNVVTAVEVEEQTDGAYLVHVTGAQYREGYGERHPLADLFRSHGRKGAHGLTIVPAWEDVRIGDSHIIGRRENSQGGKALASGILAGRIDLTLKIAVGRESVEPIMSHGPRAEAPLRTYQPTRTEHRTDSSDRRTGRRA